VTASGGTGTTDVISVSDMQVRQTLRHCNSNICRGEGGTHSSKRGLVSATQFDGQFPIVLSISTEKIDNVIILSI